MENGGCMQLRFLKWLAVLIFILGLHFTVNAQNLDQNLKILAPLLGKSWIGELKAPDGSAAWKTTREFKALWDGSVVKYSGSTAEINSFAEGYF